MVSTHKSYVNTTRVPWCKRHTAEGNTGLSWGDYCTAEERLCFLLLVFHSPSLFSQKDMGVQCHPWECGVGEEECAAQKGKAWGSLVFYTYSLLLTSFFPTVQSGRISVRGLGNYLFPDTDPCSCQILYSLTGWELFYLGPKIPEPKAYKKDWVLQKLPLSQHRWHKDLGTLQQNLYSSFLLLPIWFALIHVFSWFTSSSPPSCLLPHFQLQFFLNHFSSLWISLLISKASFFFYFYVSSLRNKFFLSKLD